MHEITIYQTIMDIINRCNVCQDCSGCGLKQGLQNSARFHVRRSDCNDKTSPFDFHSVYNQYKEIRLVDHCT